MLVRLLSSALWPLILFSVFFLTSCNNKKAELARENYQLRSKISEIQNDHKDQMNGQVQKIDQLKKDIRSQKEKISKLKSYERLLKKLEEEALNGAYEKIYWVTQNFTPLYSTVIDLLWKTVDSLEKLSIPPKDFNNGLLYYISTFENTDIFRLYMKLGLRFIKKDQLKERQDVDDYKDLTVHAKALAINHFILQEFIHNKTLKEDFIKKHIEKLLNAGADSTFIKNVINHRHDKHETNLLTLSILNEKFDLIEVFNQYEIIPHYKIFGELVKKNAVKALSFMFTKYPNILKHFQDTPAGWRLHFMASELQKKDVLDLFKKLGIKGN